MFKILGEKDMELKVTMPEHITAEEMALEAKKQVAIELFKTGDYSLGFCAHVAEIPYGDFIQLLGKNKIPYFTLTDEELMRQIKNA